MHTSHKSYLEPLFKEMNITFPNKWCVLHSYETLPYYSASDVDMAASATNIQALELLINKVADSTGWTPLQKLWYDVQNCHYYVLCHTETGTLLAIDFLMDNRAIGKYGFTTKVLTEECHMEKGGFPVPNPQVALCYKLIKRIVKKRSISDDEKYLRHTYARACKERVSTILTSQFGNKGKNQILTYLADKKGTLTESDINLLHQMRKKALYSVNKNIRFSFWETRRSFYRFFYPSGMILMVADLNKKQLQELTNILAKKVDILFRFVKMNLKVSKKDRIKGFAGSTLLICPSHKTELRSTWSKSESIDIPKYLKSDAIDANKLSDVFYDAILLALADRIKKRMPNAQR